MGNQQTQIEQIENQFDLSEILDTQTKGIEKKNILIDQKDGELVYYLVTERTVEKMNSQANYKIKQPIFAIGQVSPPITHSLLIQQNQRFQTADGNQEQCKLGVLIILIFADSKLAVLSGEELQLLKTIQLFAPLDAFRISLMYEMQFSIKEDSLHKQKQQELLDLLMKERQDFQELFQKKDEKEGEEQDTEQVRKNSKAEKEVEQSRKNSKAASSTNQSRKNSKIQQQEKGQKNEEEVKDQKENNQTENQDEQQVRNQSKSISNTQNSEEQQQKYNDFMKAQYEIFVQASKMVTGELLDIQSICYSSKSIILVGYTCGLVQKVTVEKNLIEIEEECIFFNPLNLKPKSELEQIVESKQQMEQKDVSWENFNILMLHSLYCINSTYVIAIHHQEVNSTRKSVDESANKSPNTSQKRASYKTLIYVYEYQYGKKVSYFEGTNHKIIKTLVNPNEDTNKSILYILDEQYILSLYNYEKGTFLQSFTLDKSIPILDFNAHFYSKDLMFSQISDKYKILQNLPKFEDKSIEGDIFFYFTNDCKTLITQLDYKPVNQTIQQGNGQKPLVKKVINQRHLKMLSSKIPCNYKMSVYSPELDILFIAGENGQLLRFMNFLASIYYFL